jgi:hypothetical protein
LPALHRLFPHVYYGWIVVAGTFLQSMVCVGIGFYSQQVLVDALPAVRGFDRVEVSAASSVCTSSSKFGRRTLFAKRRFGVPS